MKNHIFLLFICSFIFLGCTRPIDHGGILVNDSNIKNGDGLNSSINNSNNENDKNIKNINNQTQNNCGKYSLGDSWSTNDGCNTCRCSCELLNNEPFMQCSCTERYCPENDYKNENLVEGKTPDQRHKIIEENLHSYNSGSEAKKYFPDLELVYVDEGDSYFPNEILPFEYYYSEEGNFTVNICNVDSTVFICKGKIDHKLQEFEYENCVITEQYFPFNN